MVQVGFSTTNFILSRLIRWATKSQASHAWLLYHDDTLNQDLVMEAAFEGFRVISYDLFKKKNVIVAVIDPKADLSPGVRLLAKDLGEAYDFKGLVGAGVVKFWRWLKRKKHNPWQNANSMFCSESVVKAMQASNYPGADKLVAEDTSPQDLLDFMQMG